MFWRTNDIKRIFINNDDIAESLGVCFVTWSVILHRLMPLQQKWTSERLSVSLISTVGFEDLSNNWWEVYFLCTVLGLQATGSFRGRSWGTWWWTWARCSPRRSAPAWSRSLQTLATQQLIYLTSSTCSANVIFVQNFTPPDFQALNLTPWKCLICD